MQDKCKINYYIFTKKISQNILNIGKTIKKIIFFIRKPSFYAKIFIRKVVIECLKGK